MRPVSRHSLQEAQQLVNDGYYEWLDTPLSDDGAHPDLYHEFYIEHTPDPLDRERFLDHARDHIEAHWERLLPVMLPGAGQPSFNEALRMLELNGESVRDLNLGYRVRPAKLTGEPRFFMQTKTQPEGRLAVEDGVMLLENEFTTSDLLTLDFMTRAFRCDETLEGRRYFFRPEGRYFAANDMFAGEELADLEPAASVLKTCFENIIDNLRVCSMVVVNEAKPDERPDREALTDMMREAIEHDPGLKDLILKRYSGLVLLRQTEGRGKQLAESVARHVPRLTSDEPGRDLYAFDLKCRNTNVSNWAELVSEVDEDPRPGLKAARSEALGADFIYHPITEAGLAADVNKAMLHCMLDYLADRAAKAHPEIAETYNKYADPELPDSHPPLYFFIMRFGPERAEWLLGEGEVPRILQGFDVIRSTGYRIEELSDRDVRQRLLDASVIGQRRIWEHVLKGDPELIRRYADLEGDVAENFDAIDRRRAELYDRAETILRRARKLIEVRAANKRMADEFATGSEVGSLEVLQQRIKTTWDLLDYDVRDVPDAEVVEAFSNVPEVVAWMVEEYQRLEDPERELDPDARRELRSRFIEGLARAIKGGYDPRVILQVPDVADHLRSFVANGEEPLSVAQPREEGEDAVEVATRLLDLLNRMPMPSDTPNEVEQIEEHALFLNAGRVLDRFGVDAAATLASWRRERDAEWDELLPRPVASYGELEFELWLTDKWAAPHLEKAKQALRLVGDKTVRQLFSLTFSLNALDAVERAVRWAEHDSDLPPEALRGIIGSLKTERDLDRFEELLPKYRAKDDALADEFGLPHSLRALRSRLSYDPESIEKIRSTLEMDPRWRKVMKAPGFDFGRFVEFMNHPEFKKLTRGELDVTQPFPNIASFFFKGSLEQSLSEALGSQRRGIPGQARRPKKLFHDLKQLLREKESELSVPDLLDDVPDELRRAVVEVIKTHEQRPGELADHMVAELHHKHDPLGWVSGNYTDCCIPFGRSLNNDYMLNPATQYFTIRRGDRVIAQSVAVDARDRKTGRKAIVLDSVEIANNHTQDCGVIEDLYRAFWGHYYPNRTLLVGALNGDPRLGATKRVEDPERYEPAAPLDYSDAWRFDMYEVFPGGAAESDKTNGRVAA